MCGHVPGDLEAPGDAAEGLSRLFSALANPTRVALLHRLSSPAFVSQLSREFKIARQAVRKHLDALVEVGLVHARTSRRGALPATLYSASPSGLFVLKDRVRGIAIRGDAEGSPVPATINDVRDLAVHPRPGPGLLLVHGDVPGRWYPLRGRSTWTLGRDAGAEISLAYDPYASARHALLAEDDGGWTVTDLRSRNGTYVDFRRVLPERSQLVVSGSVLTVGHSHLVLKIGR